MPPELLPADDRAFDVEMIRDVTPACPYRRAYMIAYDRTLFGELCLTVTFGRAGDPRRQRPRTEFPATFEELERRRRALILTRLRHGYHVVGANAERVLARVRAPMPRFCATPGCSCALRRIAVTLCDRCRERARAAAPPKTKKKGKAT